MTDNNNFYPYINIFKSALQHQLSLRVFIKTFILHNSVAKTESTGRESLADLPLYE